jgi:hypothetical protein
MLLRPATGNCGRNIGPLFRIAAAKFHGAKFRALPRSDSGDGPLPLLRVQLRPLSLLFITLPVKADNLANLSPYNLVVRETTTDFKPTNIQTKIVQV